ncbi:hypothetical protein [Soonwooa sp.]|uniref:hypothetical protein n=1 Tax=Soonwooa sp. TaxID=1938592 RepID=UPI00262636A5|nr:hypothetical protein [Soonwooa sp.]
MKKNILIACFCFICETLFSQVGINTKNPQGVFNIDGGKDDPVSGATYTAAQQLNDVTVLANGNLGIGTITPATKLEIRTGGTGSSPIPGFKLADGTQAANRVLQTDANGNAKWVDIVKRNVTIGTFSPGTAVYSDDGPDVYKYTGSYITLTKGKWIVNIGYTLKIQRQYQIGYSYFLPIYLSSSTSNSTLSQTGFSLIGATTSSNMAFGARMIINREMTSANLIQGSVIINVTDPNPAGVRINVLFKNVPVDRTETVPSTSGNNSYFFDNGNWENYLYALPIN